MLEIKKIIKCGDYLDFYFGKEATIRISPFSIKGVGPFNPNGIKDDSEEGYVLLEIKHSIISRSHFYLYKGTTEEVEAIKYQVISKGFEFTLEQLAAFEQ